MLASTSLIPTKFPPLTVLDKSNGQLIGEAVQMIGSAGGSVARLCARYPDFAVKEVYLDQYKRAITGVKHHVVITADGDVETLDKAHAPSDAHECISLRLPEELYMYLSRGMIQPRVLNWLTSGTIIIAAPLAGEDSETYRNLVKNQLDPLRRQALCLLTEPIHRYYHTKDISTKLWFDPDSNTRFTSRDIIPSPRDSVSKWNVKSDALQEVCIIDPVIGILVF